MQFGAARTATIIITIHMVVLTTTIMKCKLIDFVIDIIRNPVVDNRVLRFVIKIEHAV